MQELFEHLIWEVEDDIAVLTINEPDVFKCTQYRSTEGLDLWSTFNYVPELEHATNPIRCIILQGAGTKAFVAGADIKNLKENQD